MKMKMAAVTATLVLGMSAGTVLAEGEKPAVQPAQAAPTASVAKSSAGEAPAWQKSAKPPVATNPAEPQGGDSDLIQVSGKVVETHEAGSYTYFLVEKDGKQTWVAVPPTKANIGDELSFRPGIKMVKFKSNILNREFDTIIFSVGTVGSKTDDKLLQKIADKNAKPAAAKGDAAMAAAAVPPPVETVPISGKVVEVAEGGGYSYFLIEKDGKKSWVATPPLKVKVGETVTFQPGMEMKDFTSKALNKTFDTIIFSEGPPRSEISPQDAEALKSKAHEKLKQDKSLPAGKDGKPLDVKVEKAGGANGYTVAELYEKSGALNGKEVVVTGRVVKVSKKIMGKNWVHLQDGSGDAASGTNNLVTTTQDVVVVGDVVTAKGILAKDRDFGGGYQYVVIIEETTLVKK